MEKEKCVACNHFAKFMCSKCSSTRFCSSECYNIMDHKTKCPTTTIDFREQYEPRGFMDEGTKDIRKFTDLYGQLNLADSKLNRGVNKDVKVEPGAFTRINMYIINILDSLIPAVQNYNSDATMVEKLLAFLEKEVKINTIGNYFRSQHTKTQTNLNRFCDGVTGNQQVEDMMPSLQSMRFELFYLSEFSSAFKKFTFTDMLLWVVVARYLYNMILETSSMTDEVVIDGSAITAEIVENAIEKNSLLSELSLKQSN